MISIKYINFDSINIYSLSLKMAVFLHAFLTFLYVIKISTTNGAVPPSNLPVPVPVSSGQVIWNSKALSSMPPINKWIDSLRNEDAKDISQTCKDHFKIYGESLANLEIWALQMFDSSTKIPESVASGAFTHLGNFDQCLDVRADIFKGQYCSTKILFRDGFPPNGKFSLILSIASCIPSTCTSKDLQTILQSTLLTTLAPLDITATAIVFEDDCIYDGDNKQPLDAAFWVVISICLILLFEAIVFTGCDVLNVQVRSQKVDSILKSFSLVRNFKNLMNTKHVEGTIKNMHGIRFLSILWIILGHRYGNQLAMPLMNTNYVPQIYDDVETMFVMNPYPAVDTFFFMSGFLVCYLLMKELSRGYKFNPIMYYVHRYIRLTTCYAVVIGLTTSVVMHLGNGPKWRLSYKFMSQLCKDTWWTGLLYVDNYVQMKPYSDLRMSSTCLFQGWYLSCDMQLAWLAPLVLLPLWYYPRCTAKLFLPILVLVSCFAPFTSTYLNEFYMISFVENPDPNNAFKFNIEIYVAAYMRATPYLVGISLAYFMFKKQNGLTLPKWLVACGWILTPIVALAVILSPTIMYQTGYEYDRVGSAFYAGFHRLAWSSVIGWVILACHYGYGGPIDKFLSWKGWLPLSRLSYCVFLIHLFIIIMDFNKTKTLVYFDHYSTIQRYCSDVIFSLIAALVLHLLVEAPTLGILKIFLRRQPAKLETTRKLAS